MKVRVEVTLDIDVDMWMETYGVRRDMVRSDVQTWATFHVLDAARENGVLRG